jgi:hypothetical protein
MHPRLTELKTFVDAERRAVLASAAALPVARWTEKPAPDRWSVSDNLWHLQKIQRSISKLIRTKADEARAAGHPLETDVSSVLDTLDLDKATNRSKPFPAPWQSTPTEVVTADVVEQQLIDSRTAFHEALDAADGLALARISHPHPVFGEIDLYQWILFVGLHERRNAEQIDEAIKSLENNRPR